MDQLRRELQRLQYLWPLRNKHPQFRKDCRKVLRALQFRKQRPRQVQPVTAGQLADEGCQRFFQIVMAASGYPRM